MIVPYSVLVNIDVTPDFGPKSFERHQAYRLVSYSQHPVELREQTLLFPSAQ
jgi:hypothetical protein